MSDGFIGHDVPQRWRSYSRCPRSMKRISCGRLPAQSGLPRSQSHSACFVSVSSISLLPVKRYGITHAFIRIHAVLYCSVGVNKGILSRCAVDRRRNHVDVGRPGIHRLCALIASSPVHGALNPSNSNTENTLRSNTITREIQDHCNERSKSRGCVNESMAWQEQRHRHKGNEEFRGPQLSTYHHGCSEWRAAFAGVY